MKRITMLVTVALMLTAAMALSGVAQAAQGGNKATAQCKAEAVRTLGPGFKPSDYNFIGGTEGSDFFTGQATAGPDVFCGFGGDDYIQVLDGGDIFLGGAGGDVANTNNGTFYGGDSKDTVFLNTGTFNAGDGNDYVYQNNGTVNGGAGDDQVVYNTGTFNGGEGNDSVTHNTGTTDSVENGV